MKNENRQIHNIISLFVITCIFLFMGGCAGKSSNIVIVENGLPKAVIVLNSGATEAERFAALEMQTYLRKISGAEIPIKIDSVKLHENQILVGQSRLTKEWGINTEELGREGFRIKTKDNNLVLVGRDDAGTQFAVYTFLEKYLGVRWFWPGELGEIVPKMKTIAIEQIDDTEEPDFKWRDRGPGGALWGATTGPTEMHARERLLGVTLKHQKEVELWEKRNKWGGMKIYGGHALGEIIPPEKYAKIHPEYYAWVDGKRAVPGDDYDYKHEGQICTTNPEVIKVAVEWARNFFDEHPDYDGVHLTMNDGGGFCECEKCLALDSGEFIERPGIDREEMKKQPAKYTVITDRIFTFMNQIAEEVQKTHPGKYIVSMAYSRYAKPPEKIKLHPYVIPQYCLWSAYKHANAELKKQHEEIATGWAKAAHKKGIYEYYINGSWPGMHRLVMQYMAESIKNLFRQGIDLYQTQSGDEFAINGLNDYVASKLLWDTSLDENQILTDFYQKLFGNAGSSIQRFHQRLVDAWAVATKDGVDVTCSSLENTRLLELFTPQLLDECRQDLAEAERACDYDLICNRVEFYKKGFHFTELTVAAVQAAKKLEALGVHFFPVETAVQEVQQIEKEEAKRLIEEVISAWDERDNFVEELKNDYILAYFWIKYNNSTRQFNPLENLKK
ncbi:MAG TPA: DUF4838 domain-containing protein [bacterium]